MAEARGSAEKHPLDEDGHDDHDGTDELRGPNRKRQRVRLSCLECRRRKLSCSRELPCDRCVKSGTPDRCSYESRPGRVPATSVSAMVKQSLALSNNPFASLTLSSLAPEANSSDNHRPQVRREIDGAILRQSAQDHERIRQLEHDVSQLRNALAKQSSVDGSTMVASPGMTGDANKTVSPAFSTDPNAVFVDSNPDGLSLIRSVRTATNFKSRYAGPYNAWSSLRELTGISRFMRETAEEWIKPLNISSKDRRKRKEDRKRQSTEPDPVLELLVPPKEETDLFVATYLDQFEQLHRIVHVPTFRREYDSFWDPNHQRPATFTALVLSMISVSCCLGTQTPRKFIGVKSRTLTMAEKWIEACDAWFERQSHKHRQLVHYQIQCLLYLAKKMNIIKKKRFWLTSGRIIRDAITLGLHLDPNTLASNVSPYQMEMRRRLWATMVEFDLQASFDLGVPTILTQVHSHTDAPSNFPDDSFNEDSTVLPTGRPRTEYTNSSYAHLSRQSLPIRLELCKILTGPPVDLGWDQVLQYTDLITREIDSLPAWDLDSEQESGTPHKPSLAHTLLHMQLRQYLIPLHQPFLKLRKTQSRYQTSEFIYYTAARDIILMHDRLFQKGIRSLYFLREDSVEAAIHLCNISLLQHKDSKCLISSNSQETLRLVEACIAFKEDRILRCGNNDPWGYTSMCAAYGLIETHLGLKAPDAAKAQAAERFISLHYKLLSYQVPPTEKQDMALDGIVQPSSSTQCNDPASASMYSMSAPMTAAQPGPMPPPYDSSSVPWLMPNSNSSQVLVPNPEFNFELLGMNLNDLWGDWSGSGVQ